MSKQLPKQSSLEHLKNEAKALLRLAKSGDAQIGELRLAKAQLAVAREYGFASWAKLKRAVEGYASQKDALFAAIRAGDRERVARVLDENPHLVHARDERSFGAAPILTAAQRNDRPMLDLLLKRGADIDGRSDWSLGSFGALDFADDETSQFLLRRGATLTAHAAARLGMASELRRIIERNPDAIQERGGDGQYPLHFAKTPEIVDILVDAGADMDARDLDHCGTTAQTLVLNEAVLRRLVERGAATDIYMAIALDDLQMVEKFLRADPGVLDRRLDDAGDPMIPRAPGRHIYTYNLGFVRPFQAALNLDRPKIYEYLVQSSPPRLRLLAACWKGDREEAQAILAAHPGIMSEMTQSDQQMLVEAAWFPRPQTVAVMLEAGFDVSAANGEKFTAIHWAAFHGRDDLVEIILPYKPDLEAQNVYGGTVLGTGMYGSLHGWSKSGDYSRSTELLMQAGAKLPDHLRGSASVIEVLRRYGVT